MSNPTQKCTYFLTNLETFTRTEHVKQIIVPRLQFEQLTIYLLITFNSISPLHSSTLEQSSPNIKHSIYIASLKGFFKPTLLLYWRRIGQIHHTRYRSLKYHLFQKNLEQDP